MGQVLTGAMRAIWKGALTFGLVNVPVKVYSATEDHDVSLHQVHNKDGGRIRYQRKCEVCGEIVAYQDIDKAFDDGGQTVVLTADDLASLPAERSREIDVVEFVPSEQVDLLTLDKAYYLEPDSASPKAYVLLRKTLEQTDRTAIVRFSLRQKTRLAALRVRGDVLVLQTLLWADEVREAAFPSLDEPVRISAKELELSASLVESFASDFDPSEFADEYQEELRTLIAGQDRAGRRARHLRDVRRSRGGGDRRRGHRPHGGAARERRAVTCRPRGKERAEEGCRRPSLRRRSRQRRSPRSRRRPRKPAAKKKPAKAS